MISAVKRQSCSYCAEISEQELVLKKFPSNDIQRFASNSSEEEALEEYDSSIELNPISEKASGNEPYHEQDIY